MLKLLRSRLRILWHVFRGRPTVYRVKVLGGIELADGENVLIQEVYFTSPDPLPPSELVINLSKCEYFTIDLSICLRPVITLFQSQERGNLWLCAKHLSYQHKRDQALAWEVAPVISMDIEWVETAEAAFASPQEVEAAPPPFGRVRHFSRGDFKQFHQYCAPGCVYPDE